MRALKAEQLWLYEDRETGVHCQEQGEHWEGPQVILAIHFLMPQIESMALFTAGKHSTTEAHPSPFFGHLLSREL